MSNKCEKCIQYGLCFERRYTPEECLWGKKSSPIWIIAINPRGERDELKYNDAYTRDELRGYFNTQMKNRPFFRNYEKVSPRLFALLGRDNGVAHVDIVKCYSNSFPPKGRISKEANKIINNCRCYLEKQLEEITPKVIVCNGRSVCQLMKELIKPIEDNTTSYYGKYNNSRVFVVLSGFIGRLDNYAKRRLGLEIETYLDRIRIE